MAFVLPLDGQIYFQALSLSLSLHHHRHFCQFWLSIQATNLISTRAHNKQKTITSILTTKALCAHCCITWCKQYKMWHSLRVYCLHFIKSVSLSLAILIGWNICVRVFRLVTTEARRIDKIITIHQSFTAVRGVINTFGCKCVVGTTIQWWTDFFLLLTTCQIEMIVAKICRRVTEKRK